MVSSCVFRFVSKFVPPVCSSCKYRQHSCCVTYSCTAHNDWAKNHNKQTNKHKIMKWKTKKTKKMFKNLCKRLKQQYSNGAYSPFIHTVDVHWTCSILHNNNHKYHHRLIDNQHWWQTTHTLNVSFWFRLLSIRLMTLQITKNLPKHRRHIQLAQYINRWTLQPNKIQNKFVQFGIHYKVHTQRQHTHIHSNKINLQMLTANVEPDDTRQSRIAQYRLFIYLFAFVSALQLSSVSKWMFLVADFVAVTH